jgi:hypothetical protein
VAALNAAGVRTHTRKADHYSGNILSPGRYLGRRCVDAHDYPLPVQRLLGELLTATALLANTIKIDGTLTVQATGDGPVSVLMAECTQPRDPARHRPPARPRGRVSAAGRKCPWARSCSAGVS